MSNMTLLADDSHDGKCCGNKGLSTQMSEWAKTVSVRLNPHTNVVIIDVKQILQTSVCNF